MATESSGQRASSVLITLVCSLIGVMVGATLQYYLTLKTQEAKQWSELRSKAYIQYVENTTRVVTLEGEKKKDPAKLAEARVLRDSGRFLIALYGSKSVVDLMESYIETEKHPESERFKKISAELFAAMRNDLLPGSDTVSAPLLRPILFPSQVGK